MTVLPLENRDSTVILLSKLEKLLHSSLTNVRFIDKLTVIENVSFLRLMRENAVQRTVMKYGIF